MQIGKMAGKYVCTLDKGKETELCIIPYNHPVYGFSMCSAWFPTEDEIRDMIAGKPILLHIVGRDINSHPFVSLTVGDPADEFRYDS